MAEWLKEKGGARYGDVSRPFWVVRRNDGCVSVAIRNPKRALILTGIVVASIASASVVASIEWSDQMWMIIAAGSIAVVAVIVVMGVWLVEFLRGDILRICEDADVILLPRAGVEVQLDNVYLQYIQGMRAFGSRLNAVSWEQLNLVVHKDEYDTRYSILSSSTWGAIEPIVQELTDLQNVEVVRCEAGKLLHEEGSASIE